MRRRRAALAVLTIMLTSLFVAGPASAGGPTSVLLVVPGAGQTASLYTDAADYDALAALVGASETSGVVGNVDRFGASHAVGKTVTLAWLIHDVSVWRVDRVYLNAAGGPWIATQTQPASGGAGAVSSRPPVWHTATRGEELAGLLDRLGVRPDPRGKGGSPGPPSLGGADADTRIAAPAATAAAETEKPTIQWAGSGMPIKAGLVWGFIGLAIGVGLTRAGMRLFPSSRVARGEVATLEPAEDGPAEWMPPRPGPIAN